MLLWSINLWKRAFAGLATILIFPLRFISLWNPIFPLSIRPGWGTAFEANKKGSYTVPAFPSSFKELKGSFISSFLLYVLSMNRLTQSHSKRPRVKSNQSEQNLPTQSPTVLVPQSFLHSCVTAFTKQNKMSAVKMKENNNNTLYITKPHSVQVSPCHSESLKGRQMIV